MLSRVPQKGRLTAPKSALRPLYQARDLVLYAKGSCSLATIGERTNIGRRADLYWSTQQAILVDEASYIGQPADPYSFALPSPMGIGQRLSGKQRSLPAEEAQGGL